MMKITSDIFLSYLDELFPNPICELNYNKDYELLIATMLSAQSTDKRVNEVTKILFSKYNIYDLALLDVAIIESIIKPVGTYRRKAIYVKEISKRLVKDYNGVVPNDREYIESLPGIGRKTCNVVLSNIFEKQTIAVDTHVERVSKRLKIAKNTDDVLRVEKKLMKFIPECKWSRTHLQMVLFGRYHCKSIKPSCDECKLKDYCQKK